MPSLFALHYRPLQRLTCYYCHGLLQRIVLVSYDKETDLLSLRHYSISVAPSGLRKSLKALVQRKTLPDLGNMQDVSEFVTKSGYGSVSQSVLLL